MQHRSARQIGQLGLMVVLAIWLASCGDGIETVYPAPVLPGGGFSQPPPIPPPQRIFLENGLIKLGIDLNAGGAITYLADGPRSENMINNFDLGRQLQTALYSGPIPYSQNGKQPVSFWSGLGWNPVQTGDIHNNPSQVVSYRNDSTNRLYVQTAPLIWPLLNEPAECSMEHWLELRGNVIHVRSRSQVTRRDTTQYEARTQESPCMYLNGPYYRMVTYSGKQPFTNDALLETTTAHPITDRYATENWAAFVNKEGRGVGIYRANEFRFISGFFGAAGYGGERDDATAYLTAVPFHVIDYNTVYEFEYDLVVGTLEQIRQFAYSQPRPATGPNFRFTNNRQGWHYNNTRDTGWPIRNELSIQWGRTDTTRTGFYIKSPKVFWRAPEVPRLLIEAAFTTTAPTARLNWRKPGDVEFKELTGGIDFPIVGDGQFRIYTVDLSRVPEWQGIITQIQLEATPGTIRASNERAGRIRLRSISR